MTYTNPISDYVLHQAANNSNIVISNEGEILDHNIDFEGLKSFRNNNQIAYIQPTNSGTIAIWLND